MDFHAIDHLLISDKAMRSFLERNMYQSLSYALRSVRFIEAWVSISHTTTWNARWWWWWEWSRQLTQTETFCQCDYVARHIVGIVCWIFCLLLLLPLPQPLPLLLIRFWLLLRKTDCGKTKWKRKKTHNTNRAQTASIERPQAKRFFYFFVILFFSLSLSRFVFCSVWRSQCPRNEEAKKCAYNQRRWRGIRRRRRSQRWSLRQWRQHAAILLMALTHSVVGVRTPSTEK